jgi:hypothetical protein
VESRLVYDLEVSSMLRLSTLLIAAAVLAAAASPAATAATPTAVTIDTMVSSGTSTWAASGAISDSGTYNDDTALFAGKSQTYHVFRTFTGAHGTFSVRADVQLTPTANPGVFTVTGRWAVISGTGAYAGLHGAGTINETFDSNAGTLVGVWTGQLVTAP